MKAVILAGGFGTRLHPLTINIPKPMVPVANTPLMAYTLQLLALHGFKEIYVLLYHNPAVIKDYFKDGRQFGVKITYVEAPADYGTAGAVRYACQNEKEPLLVISADLLTDFDLSAAVKFHKQQRSFASLVLTRVDNPLPYGIVVLDKKQRIRKFLEKPLWSEVFSDTVNAGIYMLQPEVLSFIAADKLVDFSQDVFPSILKAKKPLFGFIADGYWKDIGKLEDYRQAHVDLLQGKVKLPLSCQNIPNTKLCAAAGVQVAPSARFEGRGLLGENVKVEEGAILVNTVLGRNCRIGKEAYLKDCVLWEGGTIGKGAYLEEALLGKNVQVGADANIQEGTVLADECKIGAQANVKPLVKIWPRKIVEEGAIVSRSVIWRERWTKSIFGDYGVTGLCHVEINPQFAAALGAAYGSMLGKGARIACSRDSHRASRMIYRALLSGVLSAGVNVSDLEMVPIPLNRYELHALKAQGGFHVRKSPYDKEVIDIKFFDSNGMDLSSIKEKKIERRFFADDFNLLLADEAGEITFPFHRVAESYKEGIVNYLDCEALRRAKLKVVIDYAFGAASQIFPFILGELGIEVVSLNAYIDENKITKDQVAFEKSLQQLTQIVKSVGASVGIMLDTGAEKVFLCDEKGHVLNGDQALGTLLLMLLRTRKGATVALPVKESSVFAKLIKSQHGKVVRTRTGLREMMEAAAAKNVAFLGENMGGYIFPEFMPSFDAMFSTCKILEYMAKTGQKLSQLVTAIPPVYLQQRQVPCSSEKKGRVMRGIMEKFKKRKIELLDGVKVWQKDAWVLFLPDPVQPFITLYAEAASTKEVQNILDAYEKEVEVLQQ